jgi:hypothetical protein
MPRIFVSPSTLAALMALAALEMKEQIRDIGLDTGLVK